MKYYSRSPREMRLRSEQIASASRPRKMYWGRVLLILNSLLALGILFFWQLGQMRSEKPARTAFVRADVSGICKPGGTRCSLEWHLSPEPEAGAIAEWILEDGYGRLASGVLGLPAGSSRAEFELTRQVSPGMTVRITISTGNSGPIASARLFP